EDPSSARSALVRCFTAPRVPTGMNAGVGKLPRAVVTCVVRADPSLARTSTRARGGTRSNVGNARGMGRLGTAGRRTVPDGRGASLPLHLRPQPSVLLRLLLVATALGA